MAIIINIDVMLAKRKMSVTELAERVGITMANISIKKAEKKGTRHERPSALDGIPKYLPALLRAEKLAKKARKAGLLVKPKPKQGLSKAAVGRMLFELAEYAQQQHWSAEGLLRTELKKNERSLRKQESQQKKK